MMLTMWTVLVAGAAAGQELTVSTPSFAQRLPDTANREGLRITVYVNNLAQAPEAVLAQARQEVERIYRKVQIEAEWVDCPSAPERLGTNPRCRPNPFRQDWLAIRIVSPSMMGDLGLKASEFGLAVLHEGDFGRLAYVCFQCVEQLVNGSLPLEGNAAARGTILGDLMAHELGHLLLANTSHSTFGVMHPHWDRADLEEAARGLKCFDARQAQRIQAQVRERMRAQETVNMASLHSPK